MRNLLLVRTNRGTGESNEDLLFVFRKGNPEKGPATLVKLGKSGKRNKRNPIANTRTGRRHGLRKTQLRKLGSTAKHQNPGQDRCVRSCQASILPEKIRQQSRCTWRRNELR